MVSRRRALLLAAVSPVMLVQPAVAISESETELVELADPRPTFKRSDYVVYLYKRSAICPIHNIDHKYITRGCHPIAWPVLNKNGVPVHIDAELDPIIPDSMNGGVVPVTDDAVPIGLECPVDGASYRDALTNPHMHNEFRWID